MTKQSKIWLAGSCLLLTVLLFSGCSSGFVPEGQETNGSLPPASSGSMASNPVQSREGGGVTIDIEWLGPQSGPLAFDVAMNTHSVDLDSYDLGKLTVLRDSEGNEYLPLSWNAAPGGHHREGTLTFSVPDSTVQGAKYFEITIRDVAEVKEWLFRWELS